MSRVVKFAIRGFAAVGLAAVIFVAWLVLSGSKDDLDDTAVGVPSTTVEVVVGDVGESRTVDMRASTDPPVPVFFPGQGRVTDLLLKVDHDVERDTVWAAVDGRPRVVAPFASDSSFYRDIEQGDSGPDVALLQRFLAARGVEVDDDAKFGSDLRRALADYLTALTGETHDGKKLLLGDIVFIPPGLRLVSIEVGAGSVVGDGVPVFMLEDGIVRYSFRIASSEGSDIPVGAVVEGAEFEGTVTSRQVVVSEGAELDGSNQPDGGSGTQELLFTVEGTPTRDLIAGESIRVSVVVVQSAATLVVPASAVSVGPNGSSTIVLGSGEELTVTIGQSSDGLVEIIDGAQAGQLVVVPHPDAIGNDG